MIYRLKVGVAHAPLLYLQAVLQMYLQTVDTKALSVDDPAQSVYTDVYTLSRKGA